LRPPLLKRETSKSRIRPKTIKNSEVRKTKI
jgi:hypothetical protein